MTFVGHAHVHDEFSPLDGTGNRNQLTKQAINLGQSHLGCTNHGRLGSILDHVRACRNPEVFDDPDDPSKKRGNDEQIIPWLGLEAFWRPDRFMDLTDKDLYGKNGHNWAQHLCLHARTLRGWYTLMRLSSKSWVRREQGGGFYGKACIDLDMLKNDNEDIIVSTACLASPVSQLILMGDIEGATEWCEDVINIVGEKNFFLEYMPHDLDMQREVNIGKLNISYDLGIPGIVTGDVHAPYKEWVEADGDNPSTHSVVRMAAYRSTISDQDKKKDAGEEVYTDEIKTVYLSSEKTLKGWFAEYHPEFPADEVQEALDNTEIFAKRFRPFVFGKTTKLPKTHKKAETTKKILWDWAQEGLQKFDKKGDKVHEDRLAYEFGVIDAKGTLPYFYIVGDLFRWFATDAPLPATDYDPDPPKKRPINADVRGSAGGSEFAWLIGITVMDPIAWDCSFERFLNPDRQGLPDIDIDVESELFDFVIKHRDKDEPTPADGRDMGIEYLKRKYGEDHVAAIIAYQTFAPRAVIQAVAQVFEISHSEMKAVTDSLGDNDREILKLIQDKEVDGEVVEGNTLLRDFLDNHPDAAVHILRLEDQVKADSRHAAATLITPFPTNSFVPTQLGSDDETIVTAWADRAEFPIISDYGLLKLDMLGVNGLAKQELSRRFIHEHYGEDFDPRALPAMLDPWDVDPKVMEIFSKGLTLGLFQFGGRGITQLLRHIRPTSAMDISVANALYRPGPMSIAFEYGDRKNGITPVTYWHESVEPILGETLGLMCFQEQAMKVVQYLAGFSGADADKFRKIMSKLYRLPGDAAQRVMQKDHDRFIHGCMTISGLKEEIAEDIWASKMLPLGNYLFNKPHSSDYGLRAINDATIKLNWPLAFYSTLLTLEKKSKKDEQIEFLRGVLREARVFNVEALPPDVNKSGQGWTIDGEAMVYGLSSISGLGSASANELILHRPFKTFKHYMRTMPTTFGTNAHEALAKAGAFDSIIDRKEVLSRARQWDRNTLRATIFMTCGCKKTKTVKLSGRTLKFLEEEDYIDGHTQEEQLEYALENALDDLECKNHDDAEVDGWEEIDPYGPIIAYVKEHKEWPDPEDVKTIDNDLLSEYQEEVLQIPLSDINMIGRYSKFIDERIFTDEEVEALPDKPKKKGDKHSFKCQCKGCQAAECVVGGEVINLKEFKTKNDTWMAKFTVAHGTNQWAITLFPGLYDRYKNLLHRTTALLIAGHKESYKDRVQITAYRISDVVDIAADAGWEPKGGPVINLGEGVSDLVAAPKKKLKIKRKTA